MSNSELVVTVKGEKVEKSKTRYFSSTGSYYLIGDINVEDSGDCYLIKGKYRRFESGRIAFNHTIKQYVIKSEYNLIKGIISCEKGSMINGYFEKSFDNVEIYNKISNLIVINKEAFKDNYYREALGDGIYYTHHSLPSKSFNHIPQIDSSIKNSLSYDSRFIMSDYLKDYNENYLKIDDEVKSESHYLYDLSFGLEFETIRGFIPDRICKPLGLMKLRDGSISGLEYVTIPYQGAKGLQSLRNSLIDLEKRTVYDNTCSLHIHLGNIPRDKYFILALYRQLYYLQEDIFKMFPLNKEKFLNYKRKHYTKPLPGKGIIDKMDWKISDKNVNENFDVLFKWLSNGYSFYDYDCDLNNIKSHPSDPSGESKWYISSRYYIFNFIPILFGNKETIEIRVHTPTYDYNKIYHFMSLMCNVVNYVKNNYKSILQNPDLKLRKSYKHFLLTSKQQIYFEQRINFTKKSIINGNINYNEREVSGNF